MLKVPRPLMWPELQLGPHQASIILVTARALAHSTACLWRRRAEEPLNMHQGRLKQVTGLVTSWQPQAAPGTQAQPQHTPAVVYPSKRTRLHGLQYRSLTSLARRCSSPKTYAAKQVISCWTVNAARSKQQAQTPVNISAIAIHFQNPLLLKPQWRQTPSARDAYWEEQNPLAAWACMSPSTLTATRQLPQAQKLKRCRRMKPSNASALMRSAADPEPEKAVLVPSQKMAVPPQPPLKTTAVAGTRALARRSQPRQASIH